jgi:putative sterol carrier protein
MRRVIAISKYIAAIRVWSLIELSPPVTLELAESDFANLVSGKANPQRLFMGGKLKVKGDVMKATKIEPVLKKAQAKAKL